MVKLTQEMKEDFVKMGAYPFATASKDGNPNVIPIKACELVDDETVWIIDNYFLKTFNNLQENPRGALYVWGEGIKGCYQIKGDIEMLTSGEDYEKIRVKMKQVSERFPAKGLVVMKITEVYECKSGPDAGKQIL